MWLLLISVLWNLHGEALIHENRTVFKRRSVDCKTFLSDSHSGLAAKFYVVLMFISDVINCDNSDQVSSGWSVCIIPIESDIMHGMPASINVSYSALHIIIYSMTLRELRMGARGLRYFQSCLGVVPALARGSFRSSDQGNNPACLRSPQLPGTHVWSL